MTNSIKKLGIEVLGNQREKSHVVRKLAGGPIKFTWLRLKESAMEDY